MFQRSVVKLGVFSVLMEEVKKIPSYFSYKAQEGAKLYTDSASATIDFLKGEDSSESPEMQEKRKKHKEMYQAILREQEAKAAAERAKEQEARAHLSWKQQMQLRLQEAKEALAQMTSTKAGVMAVLQHCTASHAAEVAIEQGIDVKNVQMVFEKAAAKNAVGYEEVVVGYIDAPAASQQEVMAFAEKLHKACPVANSMHIEWRQGRADGGGARRADDLQDEMDRAARRVDWEESRSGSSKTSAASPPTESPIPAGMPGSRRVYTSPAAAGRRSFDAEDDAFHLPGVKRKSHVSDVYSDFPYSSNSAGKSGEDAAPTSATASRPGAAETPVNSGKVPETPSSESSRDAPKPH